MNVKKVWAVYFSATGTTEKVVTRVAEGVADELGVAYESIDFTLPAAREAVLNFSADDLVVFGTPVYAGRVPNVLLKYLETIRGNGAVAVPVVVFGNRSYDDSLIELRDILEKDGFHTIAAGAFVGEHSFSCVLGKGRPDDADMVVAYDFAKRVATKLGAIADSPALSPVTVKGTPYPYRGYYRPRDPQGNPVDMRKIRPLTSDACNDCKTCVEVCPMGSISYDDVREYTGICVRCGACVKKCPQQAKYYDDEAYLYHKRELEEGLTRRAEPELFV
ncbi:MAG: EFR1 family ferrodoxin [Dehalococcoidia bacterium]|nr:EFR1 family ferrodoxin [Dehalococcoidia bacterium]